MGHQQYEEDGGAEITSDRAAHPNTSFFFAGTFFCSAASLIRCGVLLLPGDFAMLHIVACLTGGGDHGRCPFGVGCLLPKFLRLSHHATIGEERTMAAVAM